MLSVTALMLLEAQRNGHWTSYPLAKHPDYMLVDFERATLRNTAYGPDCLFVYGWTPEQLAKAIHEGMFYIEGTFTMLYTNWHGAGPPPLLSTRAELDEFLEKCTLIEPLMYDVENLRRDQLDTILHRITHGGNHETG